MANNMSYVSQDRGNVALDLESNDIAFIDEH